MRIPLTILVIGRIGLLSGVFSCDDTPVSPGGQPQVTTLQLLSGDHQVQKVAHALIHPIEIRVQSADGTPIRGDTIVFATVFGGTFTDGGRVVSDSAGRASVVWTLGPQAGEQLARATLTSGASRVNFRATALSGDPAQLLLLVPDSAATPPARRIAFQLSARVLDAYGNAVLGVVIRWLRPTRGSIDADSTLTDRDGKAYTRWTIQSPDSNSDPVGDHSVTLRIDDPRAPNVPPRTILRRVVIMTAREALTGLWSAEGWEFYKDSAMTQLIEDVIVNGMTGTLNIVGSEQGALKWYWREEYRWWSSNIGTDIWGELWLDESSIVAAATGGHSSLECDWGDCDGPLHGRYTFYINNGTQLVLTGRQSVVYRGLVPVAAWTRLTLSRL